MGFLDSLNPIAGLIEGVGKIAGDLITTDKERLQLDIDSRKVDQAIDLAQVDVNKVEAASQSFWVSGWRPYVGWISGTALGLVYIPKALVMTGIWTYMSIVVVSQWHGGPNMPVLPPFPDLGVTDLLGLLGSLLGFGSLRTIEKMRDKAAK